MSKGPQKKNFSCGHRGFGRYCHRCYDVERRDYSPVNGPRPMRSSFDEPRVSERPSSEGLDTRPIINRPWWQRRSYE